MTFSELHSDPHVRTYVRRDCIVFRRTAEEFGGLSNMAPGYPVFVLERHLRTSEALYQACRFPHLPHLQDLIIEQASPMTAKIKSKPYRSQSRADWDNVRIPIMRWCLLVKLAQNWRKFGALLLATRERPIVEESSTDDFWGAKPVDSDILVGKNILGRLLMDLREKLRGRPDICGICVKALPIPDFKLGGRQISDMNIRLCENASIEAVPARESAPSATTNLADSEQIFLFGTSKTF